jgi:hypothetical protein
MHFPTSLPDLSDDGFEVRFGSNAIRALRRELVRQARRDIWAIERDPADLCAADPLAVPPAGVRWRVVRPPGLVSPTGPPAARLGAGAAQYRVADALPASMLGVDGVGLVPLGGGAALVLRSAALFDALSAYFDLLWETGRAHDRAAPPFPAVHLRVLRLAAEGLKDEEIATRIGISVRSVRRYIDTLEQHLGATNRLTLGIAASRFGWV